MDNTITTDIITTEVTTGNTSTNTLTTTSTTINNVFNIANGFSKFNDLWSPKIAGEINNMHIKLAKLHGVFVWHKHEDEDELFLVIKGILTMKTRELIVPLPIEDEETVTGGDEEPNLDSNPKFIERIQIINIGEFLIIPKGVEHCPVANEECEVILLEPKSTVNTGNISNDSKTVKVLDSLI